MKSLLFTLVACLAVALATAGCTTLTAPVPSTLPSDLTGYFWPDKDTSYTYVASTGNSHSITTKKGGIIVDKDLNTDSSVTLSVSDGISTVTISGLSSSDLLGLDPSLSVVADTTPSSTAKPIAIRSIATLGKALYVASDTAFYQYISPGDSLIWIQHPIWSNVRLISGKAGGFGWSLFAVELGGTHIWSTGKPLNILAMRLAPAPISCFAPGDGGGSKHSQYWIACGKQLYRYSNGGYAAIGLPFSDQIAAMEEVGGGDLMLGLQSGALFQVRDDDNSDSIGVVPFPITAMANGYIGTTNGLFNISGFPPRRIVSVRPDSISALIGWALGNGVYVGLNNDSVISGVTSFMGVYSELAFGVPSTVPVSQFADTAATVLFALAGTQLFELYNGNWMLRAQGTVTGSTWLPGTFTLLKNDTGWRSAFVEDFSASNIRGYAYWASVVLGKEGSANVQLDGIAYNNVIAVQYSRIAAGVLASTAAPAYVIYYERGFGPIRIERTQAGVTSITRIVQ